MFLNVLLNFVNIPFKWLFFLISIFNLMHVYYSKHRFTPTESFCYDLRPESTHKYKVVQIWPGQTVTCLHTNSPGHIWTTL
jgi:hypothetical protein